MASGLEPSVGRHGEEFDKVGQEQRLVGDVGNVGEERLNGAAGAGDGARQELQRAPAQVAGDGAVDHVRVRAVVAAGADERQQRARQQPPARQLTFCS